MRDLAAGMGYLAKGQKWVGRHGRWWAFGMIPALITLVGYVVALFFLGGWAGDIADWATPFADDWGSPWQGMLRTALAAIVFVGGLMLSVLTFTAVTLLVGQPFYEALCEKVDETEGGAPAAPDTPLWRELVISARDSLYVLVRAAGFGVVLFACGFIPVIGQTVVPVLGFLVSGFFLAVELTSVGLQRRGVPQRERIRLLRARLGLAFGFGVPLVLAFLVPLVTVIAMPGAVAGATLLARDLVPVEEQEEPADEDGEEDASADVPDLPGYDAQGPVPGNPYASAPPLPAEPNPYRST
ncbi:MULTISPECIES: EI24 domain-containing protein [unclassified Streptomyces]|uniref:EI24 domain-containing protein n=1 Tax=Streptomycetaceae TaxID=2062 RepID=UPI002E77E20F|nr:MULTISPECIES: EI24 domain-containing protein [unclassified Streptomyces]MED7954944.1 EI24 domain-containing protein [Streptomyces sp. BE303]MEE1827953.1 EI24 domain-containing protein [Streptomyces sp. BE20]